MSCAPPWSSLGTAPCTLPSTAEKGVLPPVACLLRAELQVSSEGEPEGCFSASNPHSQCYASAPTLQLLTASCALHRGWGLSLRSFCLDEGFPVKKTAVLVCRTSPSPPEV